MSEKLTLRAPVQDPTLVTTEDYETMQRVCKALVLSGFFPSTGRDTDAVIAQAVVKVLAGKELGIPPVASMMGVNLIQGKVSLSAHLMLAAAKRAGYDYRVSEAGKIEDGSAWVSIDWYRGKEKIGVSGFTMDEAKTAGLIQKGGNWKTYPKDMLFWRAVSRGVRRFCPDATSGIAVYAPDELGVQSDPETGEIIDIQDGGSREAQAAVLEDKLQQAQEWAASKAEPEPEQAADLFDNPKPSTSKKAIKG